MNTPIEHDPMAAVFSAVEFTPGKRFYRRMSHAAWTPAGVARRRTVTASGLVLLLAATLLAFTPSGRALAQAVLHFFTRSTGDTLPVPTSAPLNWEPVTPGAPAPTVTPLALFSECGDFTAPVCSVDQVRSKVHFTVRELGQIPAGMHFAGATGGPERILLSYDNDQSTYGLDLVEEPWTGGSTLAQWPVGASAQVDTVQVGGVTGEYVRGGFKTRQLDDPTFTSVHFDQVWDAAVPQETLHWVAKGVFYSMSTWDADPDHELLPKDAFVALASGLTTAPVSAGQIVVPPTATTIPVITFEGDTYSLTMEQAESQAGFTVRQPSKLPDIFSLSGAFVDPAQKIARLFYLEPPLGPGDPFGLRLSQEPVQDLASCGLCGLVRGTYGDFLSQKDKLIIAADTVVEDVQVGGVTGQYFEGEWGRGQWLPYSSILTLRFQVDGIAYELKYFGFMDANGKVPIGKADLIAIAESIK